MELQHLRILRLSANLIGFYDGRVPGLRFAPEPNWVDDGALSLGICSYALVDGGEALVYDTHVSVAHAAAIRRELGGSGCDTSWSSSATGTPTTSPVTKPSPTARSSPAGCTRDLLARQQDAIEAGTSEEGPPPISPLILPTSDFEGSTHLTVGRLRVEALQFNIHTADSVVLHLPREGILLAGDTLEDTVTYVSEPEAIPVHLRELDRLRRLGAGRIYPNHGSPLTLERSGYGEGLLRATKRYLGDLLRTQRDPALAELDLRRFVAGRPRGRLDHLLRALRARAPEQSRGGRGHGWLSLSGGKTGGAVPRVPVFLQRRQLSRRSVSWGYPRTSCRSGPGRPRTGR